MLRVQHTGIVRSTSRALQHPPPSRSPCAACPAFGRVCRCVACCGRSGLHLARSALLPVLCSLSGCAGGWGLHLWGIWGEPGVGWSTPRVEKIQKRRFLSLPTPLFSAQIPPPPIANLKNFPQKQKDPYKGSVFCAILALQALKGRNLQKCTPYLE